MKRLEKEQIKPVLIYSVFIVLGLLFCLLPGRMMNTIETLVCVGLLVYGLINIFAYCLVSSDIRDPMKLVKGTIATAVALLLVFINALFIISIGLVIVISGVNYIMVAVKDKRVGDKKWWIGLIVGIIITLLGVAVVVLCNTKIARQIVMIIFGGALIVDGAVRLVFMFASKKEIKFELLKKKETSEEVVEPEFEVKEQEEKVQKEEKINKKSVKNIEKIEENAKNGEIETSESLDDDDDGVEGFV